MTSKASLTFEHAIQDAVDLVNHFDRLNTQPPPPENEVLKRASLVMALAALETYFEDRLVEAVETVAGTGEGHLATFMRESLAKKRGDIAHRSGRPQNGAPGKHAVSRDDLRRHIHFIRQVVLATDARLAQAS